MNTGQTTRRDFLATTVATSLAASCACAFCELADAAPAGPVDIGTPADFPTDGPYDKFAAKPTGVLVVRDGGKIYATTAACPHKQATLEVANGTIHCPKHGSLFDLSGIPQPKTDKGKPAPAKRPLVRFAIKQDAQGHLVVDRSKTFDKPRWEDPASYVSVKA
jgi:nitrite reductase/ring-hydroxylating ferredoxin subunit